MVNDIIDGISKALNAEFGDAYKIYADNVKQDFTEPCFFITCVQQTQSLRLGTYDGDRRYYQTNQMCIYYYPVDRQQPRREINPVADRMEDCLEFITVTGDLVMGTNMQYQISDDVLVFLVNYNLFLSRTTERDPMEEYEMSIDGVIVSPQPPDEEPE